MQAHDQEQAPEAVAAHDAHELRHAGAGEVGSQAGGQAGEQVAGQVVIAGEKAAVERAIELAKEKGCKKAIPLPVSVPVHTPLMQKAANRLAADLAAVRWSDLRAPLVNNAEARAISRAAEIQPSLVRQLPSSVLWEDSVRAMRKMGVTTFIEVGPGTVLTGLIKRILPDTKLLNVNDPKSLEVTLHSLKAVNES